MIDFDEAYIYDNPRFSNGEISGNPRLSDAVIASKTVLLWILAHGNWNDTGIWIDNEQWEDSDQ